MNCFSVRPVIAFGNPARGRIAAIECRAELSRRGNSSGKTARRATLRLVRGTRSATRAIRSLNEFNRRLNMVEHAGRKHRFRRRVSNFRLNTVGTEERKGVRLDNFDGEHFFSLFFFLERLKRPRFALPDWYSLACSPCTGSPATKPLN